MDSIRYRQGLLYIPGSGSRDTASMHFNLITITTRNWMDSFDCSWKKDGKL